MLMQKSSDSNLIIEIRNSGKFDEEALKNSSGFGVSNTKHRLSLLYGENASLSLTNENKNTVLTKLKIPLGGSKVMKALVIDDERLARTELIRLLEPFKEIEVVGEAVNADDAHNKISELSPDVIFLDIQMPGKTGFELLEELDSVPKVIFTTAYDEYALKSF
ncbi:MAG: response regulator [Ignavibacteriales bacterium]|nr:response regulator [Ignavibacteriales bacterium]